MLSELESGYMNILIKISKTILGIIFSFAISILAILTLLIAISIVGKADLINLDELSLDYKNYGMVNDHQRDLLLAPEFPKEGINLNINTTFASYMFWNSSIESATTSSQYRAVGLETRIGVRLHDQLELMYYHHSQHVLDREEGNIGKFPSEDAVEIKLYFYRTKKYDTLF